MNKRKCFFSSLFVMVFLFFSCATSNQSALKFDGWKTSTPEEQGMDSELLAKMTKIAADKGVHSMVIMRNDRIVSEFYSFPASPDQPHSLYSVTKSITSALVGIAIDKGYIKGVDQSIWDFFPEINRDSLSDMKKKITLEHLLTMSSGFEWVDPDKWVRSEDPVRAALERDIVTEPGATFNYDNAGSHLLSAIVARATGEDPLEFAKKNLFTPLGITDFIWYSDKDGILWGYSNCHLKSRDMAKFGMLYLNEGMWNGEQIISAEWIKESTKSHIGVSTVSSFPGYGFQWWGQPMEGYYAAQGALGQFIFVVPEYNIVIVTTAQTYYGGVNDLVYTYIMPSIKSDNPLPQNEKALTMLRDNEKKAAVFVEKKEIPGKISEQSMERAGRTYVFDKNTGSLWTSCRFIFEEGADTARFLFDDREALIGLDNVYRYSLAPDLAIDEYYQYGFKGRWKDEITFIMDASSEYGLTFSTEFTFFEDKIVLSSRDPDGKLIVIYGALSFVETN